MFFFSLIGMLFVINKTISTIGTFGGILCGIQLIVLLASIIPTERALRRNFDQHGNRK